MMALVNSHHMWLVLTEVEGLSRMNLRANCYMKVVVTNHAITIGIKLIEDRLKLLIRQLKAPVRKVEAKLILCNCRVTFLVHVTESLSNGLPLGLNLVYNCLLKRFTYESSAGHLSTPLLHLLCTLGSVKLRVLDRVMAEVKALALVDAVAHPLTEVSITQPPFPLRVLLSNQLFQVVVREVFAL